MTRLTGAIWGQRLITVLLGVLAGLGQAPAGWAPVTVLALAVWFARVPNPPRRAFGAAWLFGVGYFAFSLRWIVEPFLVDVARHGWMAPFALVFMASGAALFWAMSIWLARRLVPVGIFALALALIAAEIARSLILTGFPWALLGHVWIGWGLDQLAAFGGPHLLTALTVLLAWALVRAFERSWIGAGVAATIVATSGALLLTLPDVNRLGPMVRLVQPNAPQDEKWDPARSEFYFNRMQAYSAALPRPDLIVWPESAIPMLLDQAQSTLEVMSEAAQGAPLVVGVLRNKGLFYHNSSIVLGRGGIYSAIYDKQHLVPFGEFIPFGEVLGSFGLRGLAASQGFGFLPGPENGIVEIPGIGAARILICYEGIFSEEIALDERPRLLVLITNDAWFGEGAGPEQHLAQARLRSIEQGVPMVRVANTGISAMIDPHGRLLGSIPHGTEGYLDVALPPARPATVYARYEDWPVLLAWIVAALATTWAGRKFRFDPEQPGE